jgi:tetratricopeptide (TPR) repeat protein
MRARSVILVLALLVPVSAAADPAEQARAFKQCTDAATRDLATSGPCYAAVATKYPQSEFADTAWFNAAVAAVAAGDLDAAVEACSKVVERYPKSRHVPEASNLWANSLERQGKLETAARIRMRLVHRFPSHDVSRDGLQSAIAWFAATERTRELNKAADLYVRYFGRDGDAPWVASLPIVRAGTDDCKEVRARGPAWLKRWGYKHDVAGDVALLLGRCFQATGDTKGARFHYESVLKREKRGAPEAAFRLADLAPASKLKVPGRRTSVADTRKWLQKRLARLQGDTNRFGEVIGRRWRGGAADSAGRWRLAAIVRTGQLYEQFASDLRAAPVPRSLGSDPEVREAYLDALSVQIRPLTQKAIASYETVIDKARELSVHDEYIALAYARLRALRPAQWPALTPVPKLDPGGPPAAGTNKERGDARLLARRELARTALKQGRPGDAVCLLQGFEDDAESLNLYAVALSDGGHHGRALGVLRTATRADPSHALAASNLAALQKSLGLSPPN